MRRGEDVCSDQTEGPGLKHPFMVTETELRAGASELPADTLKVTREGRNTEVIWQNPCSVIEPLINAHGIYSWPFDPLLPVDVRFQMYDRHTNLRMNRHDYFELLYVLHGELDFQIHRQCFHVREGDMLVIGSTFFHRPVKGGSPPAKAVLLYFLPDIIRGKDSSGEDTEYLMPFLAQDVDFPHLVTAKTGIPCQVLGLIQRIYAELPARSARSRLNVKTYLKMILVLLGTHYADYRVTVNTFHRKQENIERLHPLFDFLDEHFAETISVEEAASMVHMSKSHFIRFFKNVTGQGFVTYRHHLRILQAESLLATTDISIAELCQQVGYCDQSYFGVVFRKLAHMTPRQYRRQFCGVAAGQDLKDNPFRPQAEVEARRQGLQVLTRYMEQRPEPARAEDVRPRVGFLVRHHPQERPFLKAPARVKSGS